jgi:hypothetical protein
MTLSKKQFSVANRPLFFATLFFSVMYKRHTTNTTYFIRSSLNQQESRMKNFAIALGLLASVNSFAGAIYSNSTDVSADARSFKIWRAAKFNLATKTETRDIPNCNIEYQSPCTEEVALERTLVLAVDVEFIDPANSPEYDGRSFVSFVLPATDAGKKLNLSVKKLQRDIMVEDNRASKYCPRIGEAGDGEVVNSNCKDIIVYKPAKKTVKEVSVTAE